MYLFTVLLLVCYFQVFIYFYIFPAVYLLLRFKNITPNLNFSFCFVIFKDKEQ